MRPRTPNKRGLDLLQDPRQNKGTAFTAEERAADRAHRVTGQPQLFTEPVLRAMGEVNERPVIFALSNPTSRAECTAEQAYRSTGGRDVFSSGSPCAPVEIDGRRFVPSQTNNAYVFPASASASRPLAPGG